MSSKTKIIVLHMKEIIYTALFILLGILLILLLVFMFAPNRGRKKGMDDMKRYTPGVYTSTVTLNNADLEIEVSVDESRITSIRCVNLDETVTTMYPLLQPTIEDIAEQIYDTQSLENLSYSEENLYTSQVLVNAINEALEKAVVK